MKFYPLHKTLKNGSSIVIREATNEDAMELIALVKDYIEDSNTIPYAKDEFNPSLEFELSWIKGLNEDKNSLSLLAIHNDTIIGNISVNGTIRKMMVHTAGIGLGISSEWRNKGLGNELLSAAIEWAKNHSQLEVLWLETYTINLTGIALYKKLGFEIDGTRKQFFKSESGEYFDNLMMSLKIKQTKQ